MYLQEKPPWRKLLFSIVTGLESLPAILIETDSTTEVLLSGFSRRATFKSWKSSWKSSWKNIRNFVRDIFAIPTLTKLQVSNL